MTENRFNIGICNSIVMDNDRISFHEQSCGLKIKKVQNSEKNQKSEENQKDVQISETFLTFQKIWPP
jgi:hypothetical protein